MEFQSKLAKPYSRIFVIVYIRGILNQHFTSYVHVFRIPGLEIQM